MPGLCPLGVDLAQKTMFYEPARRITAKAALLHPYFDDLDKTGMHAFPFILDVPGHTVATVWPTLYEPEAEIVRRSRLFWRLLGC